MAAACSNDNDGDSSPTPTGGALAPTLAAALVDGPVFTGLEPDDTLTAIAAGDFNGDGDADLALGAAFADGDGDALLDAGAVYVFYSAAIKTGEVSVADADFTMTGAQAGGQAGRALLAADLNGDRIDDLVIGAPAGDADGARAESGLVFVVAGNPQFDKVRAPELDPAKHNAVLGADAADYFGSTLTSGDFDDDGNEDLVIGALLGDGPGNEREDAGEAYVIYGGDPPRSRDLRDETADAVLYGADAGDRLSESLSAGDFNGDGRDDLIVAATFGDGADESGEDVGEAYVLTDGISAETDIRDGVPGLTVIGVDDGDQLGHSSATTDFNGDGFADLLLGAVSADGMDNAADLSGEVALVLGSASPPDVIAVADGGVLVIYGPPAGRLGRGVAGGDLDGDGFGDALLGASEAPNAAGVAETGAAFLLAGSRDSVVPKFATGARLAFYGQAEFDNLATQVNGVPALLIADLNDDGKADVLIAASRALEKRGEVFVFYSEVAP